MMYLGLGLVSAIIGSMAAIPHMLIFLRSVKPQHRSVGIGFYSFAISLISMVPSPIVYGKILDTTCLKWSGDCSGGDGSCLMYDAPKMIYRMHTLAGGLILLTLFFDVWLIYWAKDLQLFDEKSEGKENLEKIDSL